MRRLTFMSSVALGFAMTGVAASAAPAGYTPPRPPVITLSAELPEMQNAQKRLSSFIRALQVGQRARAASLLSSRVSASERQGLIQKAWLRYDPKDRRNVSQVLYWPDLQIHTQRVFRDTVELAVVSRSIPFKLKNKKRERPSGIVNVRMRKEHGEWRVEMHPPRVARK
jgi:hypothetical protein